MILTIAIPTIESRRDKFDLLYKELLTQCEGVDAQVIYCRDGKEMSIGRKRQALLELAQGQWVTMVDDDDSVSPSYVSEILYALSQNPDAVGFEIECSGTPGKTASASNKWSDWADNTGGFDYVRTPYQKTPIRTSIARQVGYKDMRFGEDYDFSKRLKQSGLIKTEVYVPRVLYYYQFTYEDPSKKYGFINGRGD